MNKKITLMLITAALCASAWSCGSKVGSGSGSSSVETTSADVTAAESETSAESSGAAETPSEDDTLPPATAAPATIGADGRYKTPEGLFSFTVADNYKPVASESEEYDMAFKEEGNDLLIGIKSIIDMHQTAKGFSEGVLPEYEKKFSEVSVKEETVNGLPAAKLTAVYNEGSEKYIFSYTMVQYGNGDLFTVMYSTPATSSFSPDGDIEAMLNSLEYTGAPLKSGDEVCECGSFKCTVGDRFYIRSKNQSNMSFGYNLANSISEYMCRGYFREEEGTSAETLASETVSKWDGNDSVTGITNEKTEFMGHEAYCVKWTVTRSVFVLDVTTYYFEENGKVYAAAMSSYQDITEQFANDSQAVFDSVTFS